MVAKFTVQFLFFDRKAVLQFVDKKTASALSRIGAFVRRTARSLIRNRKNPSKPGQPPTNQTGTLREFIFFGLDRAKRSVVIGPAKTNQVFFGDNGRPVRGTVPGVLESGGSVRILEEQYATGDWYRADLRRIRSNGRPKRLRTVNIAARPYMLPALNKNRPKMPAQWAAGIRT
jgi:hypothetical protein